MKIEKKFKEIILELDNNRKVISNEVIENTPKRISEFYGEIFSGLGKNPNEHLKRKFSVDNNSMIVEKNIIFYSMCEHHFLPFFGKIDIGYIPNGKIVGFGDLVKVIETYSKRPQLQERLGEEIAETIYKELACQGVYIRIEAEHLCMTMRGVKAAGSKMITTVGKGCFENNSNLRLELLALLK
jgi:GTP cyclohydrolase I